MSSSGNRFFVVTASVMLAVVVLGFVPSLYLRPFFFGDSGSYPTLDRHDVTLAWPLYLHGALMTAWFLLAAVQPWLVASGRTGLHRRLGAAGVGIAIGVVAVNLLVTVIRDARFLAADPDRMLSPMGQLPTLVGFAACVALGVWRRRQVAEHKRLMLFASVYVAPPAVDRFVVNFGIAEFGAPAELAAAVSFAALILLLVAYDVATLRRVHRGTLYGLATLVAATSVSIAVIRSGVWTALVRFVS